MTSPKRCPPRKAGAWPPTAFIASSICSWRSNLARRVESANAYVANAHPDCLHDCIFLICDNCGQTVHLDDDKLSGGVRDAAKSAGFTGTRPMIEVRGTCGDCDE